jgi:cytoskeletal protein CcmA (bactofilin family)
MARTTFSGPVKSDNGFEGNITGNVSGVVTPTILQAPTSTSVALGAKANAVNTTGKIVGTTVYNTTTKTFYVAQGTADTSTWIDSADGTTTITPA